MKFNRTKAFLFIGLIILTGFLREHIFNILNSQLKSVYYQEGSSLPNHLNFLNNCSYSQLNILKYIFTFIFFAIYFIITHRCLISLTQNQLLIKTSLFAYSGLFVVSSIAMIVGYLTGYTNDGYTFARFCMGLGQSPFILMALIASNFLRIPNA